MMCLSEHIFGMPFQCGGATNLELADALVTLASGVLGASIAIFFTRRMERQKATAAKEVEAYASLVRYAALSYHRFDENTLERMQTRSAFTLFARPRTVEKFALLRRKQLDRDGTISSCKGEWADVVNSMRQDLGLEEVSAKDIAFITFPPDPPDLQPGPRSPQAPPSKDQSL
jgi:hypothetical protein